MCKPNVDANALVRKYEKLIYSVIAKKLPTYIGDDDLAQVGRIELWRCAKKYDPDKGKFSTYAYRAIYHKMLNELKRRKTEVSLNTIVTEEEVELQELIPDLKQSLEGVELRFELEDFYKTLTPRRQEVLKRKANGQTRKEIAHSMGVSQDIVDREMKNIKNQWKEFHNNVEEEEE